MLMIATASPSRTGGMIHFIQSSSRHAVPVVSKVGLLQDCDQHVSRHIEREISIPVNDRETIHNLGAGRAWIPYLYALVLFSSAFLSFQIQPLIGKLLLPWFGGGAGVWSICLLFFQSFLLLGYLYAHLVSNGLSLR